MIVVVIPPAGDTVVIPVTGRFAVPAVQTPLLQYWDALQIFPHRPQLPASARVLRHTPLQGISPSAQPPPGAAADRPGETVVWTSVINGGGVLLNFRGGMPVHPLTKTMQRRTPKRMTREA